MRRWRFLKIAAIISLLHLLAAAGSFVLGFSIGIKRWDSGPPGVLESTASAIAGVLLQPGVRLLVVGMPGELEWAIILGNSVLWGVVGAIFVLAVRKAGRHSAAV
jgi:hypothetical protein